MNRIRNLSSPVKLTELFPPEAIRVGLEQHSKSSVIVELGHHAVALGYLGRQEEGPIVSAIMEREDLGSTALGYGIALPHCQWRSLERSVGVVGLLHRGIPFDATDGEPVDKVFLTLAPSASPNNSIDVLGRLVAIGRDKSLRLLLGGCETAEHVSAFLDELDQPVAGRLDELARRGLTRLDRDQRDPWRELAAFGLVREDRPGRTRDSGAPPEQRWL
jgi:nitrogen PTS system EIIA component